MNTIFDPQDTPLDADNRLMDAVLREHSRAGAKADETFLARLDAALDADERKPTDSNRIAALPDATARNRRPHRLAWSLGLAAGLVLAVGLAWNNRPAGRGGVAASCELASSSAASSGEPLSTPLPPELIEGTPKPIRLPSLEPAPRKAPELYVPAGTVLLSKGKTVTSSDDDPMIGSLDLITDGEKDAGEGYFVELWEGLQWVQIDLGKTSTIHGIWLWHYHSQRRAYHDVIVQTSDDAEFKTGVTTLFNNDYDNSAKMGRGKDRPYVETRFGKLIDAKGVKARYVRLYSAGNSSNGMNHYIEVEVFGMED